MFGAFDVCRTYPSSMYSSLRAGSPLPAISTCYKVFCIKQVQGSTTEVVETSIGQERESVDDVSLLKFLKFQKK